jgi:signal transduction histidine kinase
VPRVSLRDARIRTKLAVVLLIPVISTVGLATVRLIDSGQRMVDARLATDLTEVSQRVTALSDALHHERMTAAAYANKTFANTSVLKSFFTETDAKIADYQAARQRIVAPRGSLGDRFDRIAGDLDAVASIRMSALSTSSPTVVSLINRYGAILSDLDAYVVDAASWVASSGDLAVRARGVAAYSSARSNAAEQQAAAFAALTAPGGITRELHEAYANAYAAQTVALTTFGQIATSEQAQIIGDMVTGDSVGKAAQAATDVTRSTNDNLRITADQATHDIGALVDLMRQGQERLESDFRTRIESIAANAHSQFIFESVVTALLVLLAILVGFYVARLMIRSLERLRSGALAVAHRSLRLTVDKLSDARGLDERTADVLVREMGEDIGVRGDDEIGEVAQAFHVVHREAVRIAADQAVLRATVSSMFLSLARRSQTLVDRMIAELDAIEQHEQDPKRLAEMFRLDHLATRMRRNDENLLVLAGADASPSRGDDAGLEDVLRAAQSEVELYDRIEFSSVDPDTLVASHAVNDVVRMTAELMDNATRFSPPGTVVLADARRIADYVLIQVEDRGLGMTEEQLTSVNNRLSTPGAVDVSAFRMMGLGVVGRLAHRYGIKAELLRNADNGITASLTLPRGVLILPRIESGTRAHHLAIGESTGRHALPAAAESPLVMPRSGLPTRVPGQQITGEPMSAPPVPVSAVPIYTPPAPPAPPPSAPPPPALDDTTEMPIFRQIQASWFGSDPVSAPPAFTGTPTQAVDPAPQRVAGRAPVQQDTVRVDWPSAGAPPPAASRPPAPAPVVPAAPSLPVVPLAPASAPPAPATPPPAAPRQRISAVDVDSAGAASESARSTAAAGASVSADPVAAAGPGATAAPPAEGEWRSTADSGWQAAAAAAKPAVSETTRSGLPIRTPQANLVPGSVAEAAPARVRRTPEQVQGLLSAYTRGVQRGRDDLQTTPQSEEHR